MTLHVDRVAVSMDIAADEGTSSPGRPLTDADLRERLRPLVLEILSSEIERLRREQG